MRSRIPKIKSNSHAHPVEQLPSKQQKKTTPAKAASAPLNIAPTPIVSTPPPPSPVTTATPLMNRVEEGIEEEEEDLKAEAELSTMVPSPEVSSATGSGQSERIG